MPESWAQPTAIHPAVGSDGAATAAPTNPAVRAEFLQPQPSLPRLFYSTDPSLNLARWAGDNLEQLLSELSRYGGILFRNYGVTTPGQFEEFIRVVSHDLLDYYERASPRTQVSGKIYTSTDHPADQPIFLHNENSYRRTFNRKIFFYCEAPADRGGETPIADCRKVFAEISPEVRRRFVEKGWMYVRNYGDGFGLPWQVVFQTEDRRAVEEHCRENHIRVEWKDGDRLRTRATFPPVLKHPLTGESSWFNHATFFHVSTLEPWVQEALMEEFDRPEDMPTNTFYGDGSPIEPEALEELRAAYRKHTVSFPWVKGDVLVLDNTLVAHGRAPYTGPRKILVGMSEPTTREEL
jgi:alpha-ketoglutarate-dependent taurine dioxygenase